MEIHITKYVTLVAMVISDKHVLTMLVFIMVCWFETILCFCHRVGIHFVQKTCSNVSVAKEIHWLLGPYIYIYMWYAC